MDNDTVVELVTKTEAKADERGEAVFKETRRTVFALKKSVRQTEFFQAAAVGFKPEIVLEINSFEYKNEEFCYFKGQKYKIYRAYTLKNSERTELYLTDAVGESNAFA